MEFNYQHFPRKLNLGCGLDIREGYLNVDLKDFHNPDIVADVQNLEMLPSAYYDEIIAQDVLEHLPRTATKTALLEWNRLLRLKGILYLRVPDVIGLLELFRESKNNIERQESLIQCLFGTQAYTGDFHYTGFTELLLKYYLHISGFFVITITHKDKWLLEVTAEKNITGFLEKIDVFQEDDLEFVTQAYIHILKREPDKEGLYFYLSKIKTGEMTRKALLETLNNSKERQLLLLKNGNNPILDIIWK